MYFRIRDLPEELVLSIVEWLDGDRDTLLNLARVSKHFQSLSEPYLYKSFFFRGGERLRSFCLAAHKHPWREKAIQHVEARCNDETLEELMLLGFLVRSAPKLEELTVESAFCNNHRWAEMNAETKMQWDETMAFWFAQLKLAAVTNFSRATRSNEMVPLPPLPLQALTKLTLHLNGSGREFWTLGGEGNERDFAAIFAHPTLQEMHISSVNLPDDAVAWMPSGIKTPLKRLTLDEANVTFEGLRGVLSLPERLEYLYIGENRYSPHEEAFPPGQTYNQLAERNLQRFLSILSQQKDSLRRLEYAPKQSYGVIQPPPSKAPPGHGLSQFKMLQHVRLLRNDCMPLTRLFLFPSTAPPNLKFLATDETAFLEYLVDHEMPPTPLRYPSMLMQAIPGLQQLDVVSQLYIFGMAERPARWGDDDRQMLSTVGKYMRERDAALRVLRPPAYRQFVAPILYGEVAHEDILVYINDEIGFRGMSVPGSDGWETTTDEDDEDFEVEIYEEVEEEDEVFEEGDDGLDDEIEVDEFDEMEADLD